MDIKIFDTAKEASKAAFHEFEQAFANGATTFGLATGSTPEILYEYLTSSDLDFSNAIAFNLDEYFGLPADHPQSYATYMNKHLFNKKPFKETFIPNGLATDVEAEIARYNALLDEHPIDLQILGIGQNAHIGFNEPGSSRYTKTQLVDLAESTIQANARFFDSIEDVPTKAFSMGLASIMQSKRILLLAFGESKAQAVKDMVEGPVTEEVPASLLQEHPNVAVYLDRAAASLLNK
ncbi:glucosamine-6-phosphate deaminase [Aerococcus viridans]|uniref:glucosamine-6-phosphate deaminase n=1 Tax=Aerococcus viridans TaxID=1377 RepID=UPI0028FD87EE|nr:glucosamine-6-phosphate deaminase [Aerococcus viridans]